MPIAARWLATGADDDDETFINFWDRKCFLVVVVCITVCDR